MLHLQRAQNSIQTWNKRPGHISFSTLKKMNKGDFFNGLMISNSSDQPPFCGGSVFGKHYVNHVRYSVTKWEFKFHYFPKRLHRLWIHPVLLKKKSEITAHFAAS
jgi:hypothetical protein